MDINEFYFKDCIVDINRDFWNFFIANTVFGRSVFVGISAVFV